MSDFEEKQDAQIQLDVNDELRWDPSLGATEVNATVHNGIVTLRGNLHHCARKVLAEKAALRVSGVRAVANEINVATLSSSSQTDEEIADAALNALMWNYSVPYSVKVAVENMITVSPN